MAATDLPSAIAEIKATLYRNAVGAITAVKLQQLLVDIVEVLDVIAVQAATLATDAEVAVLQPGINTAAIEASVEASVAAAEAVYVQGIGSTVLAEILSYPQSAPATPGTLWWDGGLLARTPGAPVISGPSPNPITANLVGAQAVDALLLSLPTSLPALPGRLWWDGGLLALS